MKKNEVGASGLCGTSSQNSGFFCLKSGPSLRIHVSSEKPLYLPELWKLTVSSWHSVSSADSQTPTLKKTELAKFDVLWSEHLDILAPQVVPEALLAECGDSKSFCKQRGALPRAAALHHLCSTYWEYLEVPGWACSSVCLCGTLGQCPLAPSTQ